MSRVRSVRAWGPSTGPTACALAGRRCSLWGWQKGVPGGGAFRRCEGRLWSGAPPPPTARPLGVLLGSVTHLPWARVCGCGVLMTLLWRRQENTALLSNCGLTGTPRHVSLLGLGGEGRTGGVHSADFDGGELPSPLLAEAQSIDCVISAVYFSTAQGTARVQPDPPTCTTEANGLGSRRRNQDTLHVLYAS